MANGDPIIINIPILPTRQGLMTAINGAKTWDQLHFMGQLHQHMTALLRIPNDDEHYHERITQGFLVVSNTTTAIEHLGPLTAEYLRKLFTLGEQSLHYLDTSITTRYGAQLDFAEIAEQNEYPGKTNKSQKEKRHMRRGVARSSLGHALELPIDSVERVHEAKDAVLVGTGCPLRFNIRKGGVWNLPATEYREDRWDAEMLWFSEKALFVVAQTLGYRFMRWPVYIRGQLIPGTGIVEEGRLSDWRFQYEDESECEGKHNAEAEAKGKRKDEGEGGAKAKDGA